MTTGEKLEALNEALIDICLDKVQGGELDRGDLGSMITLLKNNKVMQEKKEHSESDLIDELVEDKK